MCCPSSPPPPPLCQRRASNGGRTLLPESQHHQQQQQSQPPAPELIDFCLDLPDGCFRDPASARAAAARLGEGAQAAAAMEEHGDESGIAPWTMADVQRSMAAQQMAMVEMVGTGV